MAHRFNNKMQRKTPKPSARERTWSRWRITKNIKTSQDEEREEKSKELKEILQEKITWLGKKVPGVKFQVKERR